MNVGAEFRPACGDKLTNFVTREPLAARNMIEAGAVLIGELPDSARGHRRGNGRAKFVGEQTQALFAFGGDTHLLIERAVVGQ